MLSSVRSAFTPKKGVLSRTATNIAEASFFRKKEGAAEASFFRKPRNNAAQAASEALVSMSTELSPAEEAKLTNKNRVSQFAWCESLLDSIADNRALPVADADTSASGTPLFLVLGACPNMFAGMQAVLYSLMSSPAGRQELDFWWIKPMKATPDALETATLTRTTRGANKNDPGRSRPLYQQFADLFASGSGGGLPTVGGSWEFSWADAGHGPRATLTHKLSGTVVYPLLIWQERWSSMLARSKFIEGKLVYQREPATRVYYARQYLYADGRLTLHAAEQRVPGERALPPDALKRLATMVASPEAGTAAATGHQVCEMFSGASEPSSAGPLRASG